ncbi:MAG: hypothetical protein KAR05_03790 [Candidatus Omnitrophica bacterium]|nr:hypothetical protein [Candidatus Omnitrophota bacterium]
MVEPKRHFNTLEIIIIMLIIGLMLMAAIPRFIDIKGDLRIAMQKGVINGIRMGIRKYRNEKKSYPSSLDNAKNGNCSSRNPCFSKVLASGGVTGGWKKKGYAYISSNDERFSYDPVTGRFN